ncbi:oxidoreductase [Planomonospora venezuelensis]|uniref:NAD(P)-dependent dehydrogenase (Short-subunit alcohol dehydrogenase family) n=1 Tax=Planomonospora venezuelensis TaxID=1999 RepID=A0A841CYE3_PLAVE|nr:oxidoreductase [Planomonospora venezuelensis]MBB5960965.1 NAD(P)-dependent dehydrogenase (short-subunit alcohol dehydrogenase family) [Planomonospora venezuelensis]GIN01199.1 short-chain dehydrogenase [Planomonospora venezuelensis]
MARWTAREIPGLGGRNAVVTGAGEGVGLHTALELVRYGARVVIASRDRGKGEAAAARIRAETGGKGGGSVEWLPLDLGDLSSVERFATGFSAAHDGLDLLVNNAGVMALPRGLTADGFERQFGVNHLGHFALTGLLLPVLLARPGARVVTVTSGLHRSGRMDFDDLMGERRYGRLRAYTQSKLANVLFALELHRRVTGAGADLVSAVAHPGVARTNLARTGNPMQGLLVTLAKLPAQSAAAGALPSLYAATAAGVLGGEAFGPDGFAERRGHPTRIRPAAQAYDRVAARRLWETSEELTGVRFSAFDRGEVRP